jgi:hypothetical protein
MKMPSVVMNLNNYAEIRHTGLEALKNALGIAGVAKFFQQIENGRGDYTKEKYNHPDMSLDEIDELLRKEQL